MVVVFAGACEAFVPVFMLQQCAVAWQVVGHSSAACREPSACYLLPGCWLVGAEGNQKIVAILTPRLAKAKEKVDAAAATATSGALYLLHVSVRSSAQAHKHNYKRVCVYRKFYIILSPKGSAIAVKCSIKKFPSDKVASYADNTHTHHVPYIKTYAHKTICIRCVCVCMCKYVSAN